MRGWKERKKYRTVRKGIIAAQARFRGKRQRKRYLELSAELKRRAAAEKAARDRAKVKAQKEEQERASRAVAGVNHLEIPAELAFIFSKLDGKIMKRSCKGVESGHAQKFFLASSSSRTVMG